ncbi:protein involved in catabolism of external DNA [Caulobacter sp. Root655]|uniref:23S rRNA (adenine(2030)-N(6))-methyltransferase RlmJ n=1 Tax=Caulobacter sp. Root655 TaxID=1736578 RepID=UPI0006F8C85E|nr:23S rRNA (adenine(2030)-N(6))-methyltransferase RlmJ [Caulobacter sp. Root655]KRA63929.1 protein involved in catabolism of external DNA [Caulobacter sp. Root655]
MNYRHAFHAGNFADLQKHAILIALLTTLTADETPLSVIDTHAGAGAYDLGGDMAQRSGEAAAGIGKLLAAAKAGAAPAVFAPLVAAVKALNGGGEGSLYPGSPLLIARSLRKADRYVACELRPDDFDSLRRSLAPYPFAQAVRDDGYATAVAKAGKGGQGGGKTFVLIDPPFERSDDYAQIVATTKAVLARDSQAVIAAWMPLKDLETFDAFMRAMETVTSDALAAELRLRPLVDPMKMNGCAMVMVGAPRSAEAAIAEVTTWLAENVGDTGARARIWRA